MCVPQYGTASVNRSQIPSVGPSSLLKIKIKL